MFCKIPSRVFNFHVTFLTLFAGLCCGASYDIGKVVMTGDKVPGLDENFRFFRAVHMFPDGSVAFAGITTRGQNILRDQPRGIYLNNPSGESLSVIAEMNDEDAWRSIGVPINLMDSNDAQAFAFDYLQPSEFALSEVIALREFGEDLLSLSPADGSNARVRSAFLGETEFYEGQFDSDLSGLVLNEAGQLLFTVSFFFKDDPDTSVKGIYLATKEGGIRNIAFAGDAVPGIVDATFSSFSSPTLAEDGTALFSAQLEGAGAPSESNSTLWMEKEGEFTLVLREGDPAPGIPDFNLNLTGNLNILYLDALNDRTLVFSGVQRLGQTTRAYWIGTPFGPQLAPILQVDSTPNLNDPGIFTATGQGPVAFTSVDNNSIQLDSAGEIYFVASGKLQDDTHVSGIWKRSIIDGGVSLLVPFDFTEGLTDFKILDVNDNGVLFFLAESNNVLGLWARSLSGELTNLVNAGNMLEGREITGLADLATVSGGFSQSTKTLGDHRFHDLVSDSGNVVFVARFADSNGDGKSDEGIFVAGLVPDPTDMFVWSGDAGDRDWHKALNWDDGETGQDADHVPGDPEGKGPEETVLIEDADVVISTASIHLKSINASGRLELNQSLALEEASSIENPVVGADITTHDDLALAGGDGLWVSGSLRGTGAVVIPQGATLETTLQNEIIVAAKGGFSTRDGAGPELDVPLKVRGNLIHKAGILQLLGVDTSISVEEGGVFEIVDGGITTEPAVAPKLLNQGTFKKTGASESIINTYFENLAGGLIETSLGTLTFFGPNKVAGRLEMESGSAVNFRGSDLPTNLHNFSANGSGTLRFFEEVHLEDGTDNPVWLSGGTMGLLVFPEGTKITGPGTLTNKGHLQFMGNNELRAHLNIAQGVVNQTGELIFEGGGGKVTIAGSATYQLQANSSILKGNLPSPGIFLNADGNLEKVDPGGTSVIETDVTYTENLIDVAPGSNLSITGIQKFSDGTVNTFGEGIFTVSEMQTTGGELRNNISGSGKLRLIGDVTLSQGKLFNSGLIDWSSGQVTGGSLAGETVEDGLLNQAAGTIRVTGPVRLAEGVLENRGRLIVDQSLNLAGGELINRPGGIVEIAALGGVVDTGAEPSTIHNRGGTIAKTGGTDSEIAAKIDSMDGSIETTAGNLQLTGEVAFDGDSKITAATGSTLRFVDNRVTARKLSLSGQGQVVLSGEFFRVTGPVLNTGRLDWQKGRFVTGNDFFTNRGEIVISNPVDAHELSDNLRNDGFIRLDKDVEIQVNRPMGLIENRKDGTLFLSGLITGTDWVLDNQGLLQLNAKDDSWELRSGKIMNTGTVQALENSRATLRRVDQVHSAGGPTGFSLLDGEWIVADGSKLTLTDPLDAEAKFGFIAEPAIVTIHGSGKLNDLPPASDQANVDFYSIAGELNLLNGAQWSGSNLDLASAVVVPPGSRHYGGILFIDSNSAMEVSNLGTDPSTGQIISGFIVETNAVATINGTLSVLTKNSFMDLNSEILLRNGGMIQGNGTLKLSALDNGGIERPGTLFIEKSNRCGLADSITVLGNVTNTGNICPGRSPGTITIQGDYQQTADGKLEIELVSIGGGYQYDQLVVSGTASLGGTLFIRSDLEPALESISFEPIMAGSVKGTFDRVVVASDSARNFFDTKISASGVQIVPQTLSVNSFGEWKDFLFSEADIMNPDISSTAADPDGDGFANLLEYALDLNPWMSNGNPLALESLRNENGEVTAVRVSFPWAKDLSDVTYDLESSTDLEGWLSLETSVEATQDEGTHDLLSVYAPLEVPASSGTYIRLRVLETL